MRIWLENFLFPIYKSTKLPVNTCNAQTANTGLSFFNQGLFCPMGTGLGWQIQSCTGSRRLSMCCSNWCRCGQLWYRRQRQQTLTGFHQHTHTEKQISPLKSKISCSQREKCQNVGGENKVMKWKKEDHIPSLTLGSFGPHRSLTWLQQSKI